MASGARRITVEFLGNDKTLSKTAGQAENRVSKLGDRMRQVGKVAAIGLAAGVVVAGKAMWEMGKAAAEDAQSQALLERALKNSTGATKAQVAATEDWITAQGKALGVADDQLRPALATLARATGDVTKAQQLAALAMDISAGTGKDLGTVSLALAKAQNGQTAGLQRLGVNMKDATGKTVDFEEAQKRLSDQFGGAAATNADTLSGKVSRLRLMFDETKETIGAKLLPVVEKFATWLLNDGGPAVATFVSEMRTKLQPAFAWLSENVPRILAELRTTFETNFGSIKETVTSFVSIVQSLWARFGETITAYTETTWGNIKRFIGGALQVISGIFKTFSALLKGDWKGTWDGIKQILSGALSIIRGIVGQLWNMMTSAFRIGAQMLKGIFIGLWNGLRTLAVGGVGKIVGVVRSIGGKISAAASGAFEGLKNAFRNAVNFIIDKWNGLSFGIPGFDPPGPGSFGGFSVSTPNIERFAKGGIVKARPGGILANIGEAGHDEAVIPLTGPHALRGMGGSDGAVANLSVNLNFDGKAVQTVLLQLKRRNGGLELGIA